MFLESIALSLITAFVCRRKLSGLEHFELKGWYLFIIGFMLQALPAIIEKSGSAYFRYLLAHYFFIIHILSYILVVGAILWNIGKKSMSLILIGTILNFTVITINGGKMPVSLSGLAAAGYAKIERVENNIDITHSIMNRTTKLPHLADIIPLHRPYAPPTVISIGDILMSVGMFFLIQEALVDGKGARLNKNAQQI